MPEKILCAYPFTMAGIGPGGNVMVCCGLWSKVKSIGNLKQQSLYSIWNGEVARAIRRAMYSNTVEHFCSSLACPIVKAGRMIIVDGTTSSDHPYDGFNDTILADIANGNDFMRSFPTRLSLSFDDRCNLTCVMCPRSATHPMFDESLSERIFTEIEEHRDDIRSIMLAGNGDPFVIPHYRRFLQTCDPAHYPHLKIIVLTNGLLLDKKMWETIKHNRFESIKVSVDAATRETYSKIRVGGSWERLLENLSFLGEVRKAGGFPLLEINMTVMRSNYREVSEFIELGRSIGADSILFQMIFDTWHNENYLFPVFDKTIVGYLQQFLTSPEARGTGVNVSGLLHLLHVKEQDMLRIQPRLTDIQAERDQLRAELAAQKEQIRLMDARLRTLEQLFRIIQMGRAYRVLRRLGHWEWVERTLAELPEVRRDDTPGRVAQIGQSARTGVSPTP